MKKTRIITLVTVIIFIIVAAITVYARRNSHNTDISQDIITGKVIHVIDYEQQTDGIHFYQDGTFTIDDIQKDDQIRVVHYPHNYCLVESEEAINVNGKYQIPTLTETENVTIQQIRDEILIAEYSIPVKHVIEE